MLKLITGAAVMALGLTLMPAAAGTAGAEQLLTTSESSPTPPHTGTWKFIDSQNISAGSLTVIKKHGKYEVEDLHGTLAHLAGTACPGGAFSIKGTLHVKQIKVNPQQRVWAVAKGPNGTVGGPGLKPLKVEGTYRGKTVHGGLQISFANPTHGTGLAYENAIYLSDFNRYCTLEAILKHK